MFLWHLYHFGCFGATDCVCYHIVLKFGTYLSRHDMAASIYLKKTIATRRRQNVLRSFQKDTSRTPGWFFLQHGCTRFRLEIFFRSWPPVISADFLGTYTSPLGIVEESYCDFFAPTSTQSDTTASHFKSVFFAESDFPRNLRNLFVVWR